MELIARNKVPANWKELDLLMMELLSTEQYRAFNDIVMPKEQCKHCEYYLRDTE